MADYNEMLLKLRNEVATAISLGTINTELYAQQMIQLLNSIQTQKQKAQAELERIQGQIGECKGRMSQCDLMAGLVVEIVAAYNRAEQKRLEEERRFTAERRAQEEEDKKNATAAGPTPDPEPTPKKKRR